MLAKAIKRYPLVRFLIDLRLTVVCLSLLFVLTFLGTVHQYSFGLYSAQQKYFESFFTLVAGFIPFPGTQLVMWVLFVNLVSVTIYRFSYKVKRVGILIIHAGIFVLFFGMFFTQYFAQESYLQLSEGEGRNVTSDYFAWEVAFWDADADTRRIAAFDLDSAVASQEVVVEPYGVTLEIERLFANANAYTVDASADEQRLNGSGIGLLEETRASPDPQENFPGILAAITTASGERLPILLYGADLTPTTFVADGRRVSTTLRRKSYHMPLVITLQDFRADFFPNSDTPESFESDVVVRTDGGTRPVRISMNNPLRYAGYTFYQASYAIDATGGESSTFAVVKSRTRLVPYVGTGILGLGLIVHFVQVLAKRPRRAGATVAA